MTYLEILNITTSRWNNSTVNHDSSESLLTEDNKDKFVTLYNFRKELDIKLENEEISFDDYEKTIYNFCVQMDREEKLRELGI